MTQFPRTASVASVVHVLAHTGSTNADAVALARGGAPHRTVVLTDDQRSGRGRLDRQWVAAAGSAIACSVVLDIASVPAAARGWIPLVAGLAVREAVADQLPDATVTVKWPNDVLVAGQKISGILAEVAAVNTVVVGFGVNTAMPTDALPVPTATSFAALGATCDVDALVARAVARLDAGVAALTTHNGVIELRDAVIAVCSTLDAPVRVILPNGADLVGTAIGLDEDGRLLVRTQSEGEVVPVAAGDVVHVRA